MMTLPRFLTTVTPFSRYLAILVCITLPFVGFLLGIRYQEIFNLSERLREEGNLLIEQSPSPTSDETASWKTYKVANLYELKIAVDKFPVRGETYSADVFPNIILSESMSFTSNLSLSSPPFNFPRRILPFAFSLA